MTPTVSRMDSGYAIRCVRPSSGVVLMWVQDLTGRKLKNFLTCSRPVVIFSSKAEAEQELQDVVAPYILKEKL